MSATKRLAEQAGLLRPLDYDPDEEQAIREAIERDRLALLRDLYGETYDGAEDERVLGFEVKL